MLNKKLIILGSGGYGRTALDVAEQLEYNPVIVLDDADSEHPLASFKAYLNLSDACNLSDVRMKWKRRVVSLGIPFIACLLAAKKMASICNLDEIFTAVIGF